MPDLRLVDDTKIASSDHRDPAQFHFAMRLAVTMAEANASGMIAWYEKDKSEWCLTVHLDRQDEERVIRLRHVTTALPIVTRAWQLDSNLAWRKV